MVSQGRKRIKIVQIHDMGAPYVSVLFIAIKTFRMKMTKCVNFTSSTGGYPVFHCYLCIFYLWNNP